MLYLAGQILGVLALLVGVTLLAGPAWATLLGGGLVLAVSTGAEVLAERRKGGS